MPADADGVEFSSLKLYANEDIFTKAITYNPSEAVIEGESPTLTATKKTNILSVSLGDVVPQDNKISAYVLALPSELINKSFDIELTPAEGNFVYVAHAMALGNWNKGKLKTYSVDATRVELGTNLSVNASGETATANSYIISAGGTYNFLANVKGNGIDPIEDDDETAAIESAASVEVLWETVNTTTKPEVGTIIKSAKIYHNRVVFSTPDNFTEGNALISVKDAGGNILWSWHIWATDAPQAQEYKDKDGNPVTPKMMDRNLGALSSTVGEATSNILTHGFFYQWGRPFPIMGYEKTTNIDDWTANAIETSETNGTLAYSRQNPARMIYASAYNTVSGNWYWGSAPLFWDTDEKTMYDPCPIGWRVPAGNTQWTNGFNTDLTTWISNSGKQGRYVTDTPSIYYPASGYRGATNTAQSAEVLLVGVHMDYWSSQVDDTNGYHMYSSSGGVSTAIKNVRAGYCVRPEKE